MIGKNRSFSSITHVPKNLVSVSTIISKRGKWDFSGHKTNDLVITICLRSIKEIIVSYCSIKKNAGLLCLSRAAYSE